jgi:hypothetical protein
LINGAFSCDFSGLRHEASAPTSATTTPTLTFVDAVRLEGLTSTSATTTSAFFTLVDMVRIEGFAIYFGDYYFSIHLRQQVQFEGLAVYAVRLEGLMSTSATTTSAFTLVT